MNREKFFCGFVTILGKPNVGKSTLLNKLIGKKVSITSNKPQTTKHNIIGINTIKNYQSIYIDVPGLQSRFYKVNIFNKLLSLNIVNDSNLIIMVIDVNGWNQCDEKLVNKLILLKKKVILVINKIDHINDKKKILPYIKFLSKKMNFLHILPVSAKKNIGIDIINNIVFQSLPENIHYFPNNYFTNHSKSFMASEIIREKLMRYLNKELPYSIIIKIQEFIISNNGDYHLQSIIFVKKKSHKKIIIGFNGNKIKKISIAARLEMEKLFSNKVILTIWVKYKVI